MIKHIKLGKGFTLIEILIVIGIIAILSTIVIIAINPARQFAQARNTQRVSNVNTILNAIGQNLADNKGLLGGGCPSITAGTVYTIAKTGSVVAPAAALIDLTCLTPTYIPSQLPLDPSTGVWTSPSDYNTQYNITYDSTSLRYTVFAPKSEIGQTISVTR
ncbi:MAG: prepilin-type N-terminal cleavage/methylation domain-containing protein [Patescibacteria group bacterium]